MIDENESLCKYRYRNNWCGKRDDACNYHIKKNCPLFKKKEIEIIRGREFYEIEADDNGN